MSKRNKPTQAAAVATTEPTHHQPTMPEQITYIPVEAIAPSPFNYRSGDIAETNLLDLAESLKKDGMLQPVRVRPGPEYGQADAFIRYELVFGHRRLAAAQLAGLERIPAILVEMDDAQVKRAQFAENIQRENTNAIDEAHGLQSLLNEPGVRAEDLPQQLGKSRSWVYNRLRLLKLNRQVQDAVANEGLGADIAILIATLPAPMQADALDEVREHDGHGWLSVRDAKAAIKDMMVPIERATFTIHLDTYGDKPACTSCPSLSQNDEALRGLLDPDICTNSKCFDMKTRIHGLQVVEEAKKSGQAVKDDLDDKKWPTHLRAPHGYTAATDPMWHRHPDGYTVGQTFTWGQAVQALKDDGQLVVQPTILLHPKTGVAVDAYTSDDIGTIEDAYAELCDRLDEGKKEQSPPNPAAQAREEANRKAHDAWQARQAEQRAWIESLTPEQEVVRTKFWPVTKAIMSRVAGTERTREDLLLIADHMVTEYSFELDHDTLEVMGWKDLIDVDDQDEQVMSRLKELGPDQVSTFIVCLALSGLPTTPAEEQAELDERLALAKRYGVDVLSLPCAQEVVNDGTSGASRDEDDLGDDDGEGNE